MGRDIFGIIDARCEGHMRAPGFVPLGFVILSSLSGAAPTLRISGGLTLNGQPRPLLFTWNTPITATGGGWVPGENLRLLLHGPLDSPDVGPRLGRATPSRVTGFMVRG